MAGEPVSGPCFQQRVETATAKFNLGVLLSKQERFDEAERLYSEALRFFEQQGDADDAMIALVLTNYAALLGATGRDSQAREMSDRMDAGGDGLQSAGDGDGTPDS